MIRSIDDFLTIWKRESASTQRVLDALTNASLKVAVSRKDRTAGRMAWHIV